MQLRQFVIKHLEETVYHANNLIATALIFKVTYEKLPTFIFRAGTDHFGFINKT